jgi:hypothetical protein
MRDFHRRAKSAKFVAILLFGIVVPAIAAEAPGRPQLYTNQSFIEDVARPPSLPLSDVAAMFQFVLESLPDRVKVYPTENYFYFWFYDGGQRYAGNIRLGAGSRDHGKVQFHYAAEVTEWNKQGGDTYHAALDQSHGVSVQKVGGLAYRVSYRGRSVIFELNDLSKMVPPPHLLGPDERYLGPIFDESAVRFFLVYNARLRIFHYVLDETGPPHETFFSPTATDRILIGRRTGFAFYRDHRRARKILIGVFGDNVGLNNYYDGPFDQLPENFIEGESLRSAMIEAKPDLAGKIDRFGGFLGSTNRYLIAPYLNYSRQSELLVFHTCADEKKLSATSYYACFIKDHGSADAQQSRVKKISVKAKNTTWHQRQIREERR